MKFLRPNFFQNTQSSTVCPFCNMSDSEEIMSLHSVLAIEDKNPVTQGHVLIVPKRHTQDFFTMNSEEKTEAMELIGRLKEQVLERDPSVKGFNIGMNCGTAAGQTVSHAHIHLIPRRSGDTEDPRGGVRGVIPQKRSY